MMKLLRASRTAVLLAVTITKTHHAAERFATGVLRIFTELMGFIAMNVQHGISAPFAVKRLRFITVVIF